MASVNDLVRQFESAGSPLAKAQLLFQVHSALLALPQQQAEQTSLQIGSPNFIKSILEFVVSGEAFTYFGLRVLDHMSFCEEVRRRVVLGGGIHVSLGLLRTNDYELVVSSLSLLQGLVKPDNLQEFVRCNGVKLLVRLLAQYEVEFV
jgi:hypothetical protein